MILPNGSIYLTNIITKIDLLNKSIYQTVLDCSNRPFHGAVFYYIFAILIVATLVIRDFNYHPTNQNHRSHNNKHPGLHSCSVLRVCESTFFLKKHQHDANYSLPI